MVTAAKIADRIRSSDRPISKDALARELGLTVKTVETHLRNLEGTDIRARTGLYATIETWEKLHAPRTVERVQHAQDAQGAIVPGSVEAPSAPERKWPCSKHPELAFATFGELEHHYGSHPRWAPVEDPERLRKLGVPAPREVLVPAAPRVDDHPRIPNLNENPGMISRWTLERVLELRGPGGFSIAECRKCGQRRSRRRGWPAWRSEEIRKAFDVGCGHGNHDWIPLTKPNPSPNGDAPDDRTREGATA